MYPIAKGVTYRNELGVVVKGEQDFANDSDAYAALMRKMSRSSTFTDEAQQRNVYKDWCKRQMFSQHSSDNEPPQNSVRTLKRRMSKQELANIQETQKN